MINGHKISHGAYTAKTRSERSVMSHGAFRKQGQTNS